MNRLTSTTAIALVLSLAALGDAQAFTQPNSVSPAYMASMAAQAAAGRAASQTTIAAPAYNASLAAQAAAGRAASQTTIAAPGGTFSVPNVKATIATGPITVPKPGSTTPVYGPYSDTGGAAPNPLTSLTDVLGATDQTFSNPAFANGLTNMPFGQPQPSLSAAVVGAAGAKAGGAINNQSGSASALQSAVTAAANAIIAQNATLASLGARAGGAINTAQAGSTQAAQANLGIVGVPGVNGTTYAIPQSTSNGGQSSNGGQPAIGSLAGINLANAFNAGAGSGGATTGSSGGGGGAGAANGGLSGASNGANTGGAQSAGPLATNGTFGDFLGSSSQQSNVPSGAFQTNANNASAKQAQLMVTAANNGDTQFTTVPPASLLAISGTTLSAGTTNPIIKAYNTVNTNLYEFNNSSAGKTAGPLLSGLIIGLGTDGVGTVLGTVAEGVPVAEAAGGMRIVQATTEAAGTGTQLSEEAASALSHVPPTTLSDKLYNLYMSIVK